ncbi:MAG: hypothetical protein RL648_30 [Verrucomicrobiota bacterium]
MSRPVRQLVLVLGDQLNEDALVFKDFDPKEDRVLMMEVREEATHVWSSKPRLVYFLSAMRHFAERLRGRGYPVEYWSIAEGISDLGSGLRRAIARIAPERIVCVLPGDWRVKEQLEAATADWPGLLRWMADNHFMDTPESFQAWASQRRGIRLEFYYRDLRKRFGILMEADGKPVGGAWNFDKKNRGTFPSEGPDLLRPVPPRFEPDTMTRAVMEEVEAVYPENPGDLASFAWPVDRQQALLALSKFIEERLPEFGTYQDAMWTNEPFLYHSLLSACLNTKLLDPREVMAAAEAAYREGKAPLNAVEGFIRQILGWREYVRGIYWWQMPRYVELNALGAREPLPGFYWDGQTPLRCLRDAIGQTLEHGYAHHIQRLMVTGLYGLLLGVDPKAMHEWYLAVYIDAVEWVELPNTLGMSQYADGGLMASKPYVATGKYIQRMSNYCAGCPARPDEATGERACPFTTLYWDFLIRHEPALAKNQRMSLQVKNLERKSPSERQAIQARAEAVRRDPSCGTLFA